MIQCPQQYGFPKETDPRRKYNSKGAAVYRDKIKAAVEGRPWSAPAVRVLGPQLGWCVPSAGAHSLRAPRLVLLDTRRWRRSRKRRSSEAWGPPSTRPLRALWTRTPGAGETRRRTASAVRRSRPAKDEPPAPPVSDSLRVGPPRGGARLAPLTLCAGRWRRPGWWRRLHRRPAQRLRRWQGCLLCPQVAGECDEVRTSGVATHALQLG